MLHGVIAIGKRFQQMNRPETYMPLRCWTHAIGPMSIPQLKNAPYYDLFTILLHSSLMHVIFTFSKNYILIYMHVRVCV